MRLFFFCLCSLAFGAAARAGELSLAPLAYSFDYTETDRAGATLDRERGELAGVELSASERIGARWDLELGFRWLGGRVDYDGQTQAGQPHRTRTAQRLQRNALRLTRHGGAAWPALHAFAGAAVWNWDRDIRPRNNVSGLREHYRWVEYELGAGLRLGGAGGGTWLLQLSHLEIPAPRVVVDLREFGFGQPRLRMAAGSGNRLLLDWHSPAAQGLRWGVGVLYERWDFGASDPVTISNGAVLSSISEPASDSEHLALQLGVSWRRP